MLHDIVLTIFVAITAIAFVVEAGVMVGMYTMLGKFRREFESIRTDMLPRVDSLVQSVSDIVSNSREPIRSITANTAEVTRIVRERADYVDAVITEVADMTRAQALRLDQLVTGLTQRAQSTADVVERGIVTPVQEVSAVVKGIRAGLDSLLGRRAPHNSEIAQEEQMFI